MASEKAENRFTNKLEQLPALKSRITGAVYLNPLSFEDAVAMLRYRVSQVSDEATFDRVFPSAALHHHIYKAAGGVPRDLCVLCNAAMVNAYGLGNKTVTEEALKEALKDFKDLKFAPESGGK